jgi:hypothetical protein
MKLSLAFIYESEVVIEVLLMLFIAKIIVISVYSSQSLTRFNDWIESLLCRHDFPLVHFKIRVKANLHVASCAFWFLVANKHFLEEFDRLIP